MPQDSLGDFLSILQDAGDLVRIAATVDSALEIAEITRRVSSQSHGGPALFFESVRGSSLPVVTNVLGSESRLCRALGVSTLDELTTRLTQPGPSAGASGWLESWKLSPFGHQFGSFAPRVLKQAYCQQIVKLGRDVNLWELPIPRSWPDEPHPVITLGQVVTRCPNSGRRQVELIPLQAVDPQQLVPYWHRFHQGHHTWQSMSRSQQQMPIAIALGGQASGPLAALAALPEHVDPGNFAGLLRGSSVEVVKCRTNDLEVPAHAEIVIEGMIDPAAALREPTPVGLPTGYYSSRTEPLPIIQVTAMTHRANPIFPAQIFGPPPSELTWMGRALERLMLPWIQAAAPEITDWHFPEFGAGRNWLFVSFRKTHPQQAHQIMHAVWGHPLGRFVKGLVVVDESVNVRSSDAVWFAAGTHVDPSRDVVLTRGLCDGDDPAGTTQKLGIDATKKLSAEHATGSPAREMTMNAGTIQQVTDRWAELGLPLPMNGNA